MCAKTKLYKSGDAGDLSIMPSVAFLLQINYFIKKPSVIYYTHKYQAEYADLTSFKSSSFIFETSNKA